MGLAASEGRGRTLNYVGGKVAIGHSIDSNASKNLGKLGMPQHKCKHRKSFDALRADPFQGHCLANFGNTQVKVDMDQILPGLQKTPFSSNYETAMFFEGVSHREALARLRFLRDNRRMGLILGDSGTGKSLLLKVFEKECRRQCCSVAAVNLLGISPREFYWQVASQLDAPVRLEDDQLRLFRQVSDRIAVNQLQNSSTVVLLDDAHQADPDLLSQVFRLTQIDAAGPNPLTLVLASTESKSAQLGEQLLGQIDLRIDLEAWDELDTTGYLQLAQVEAGCQQPLFHEDAISEIYQLSSGIPRRVNRLADYSLLNGASSELIDAETIRTAFAALSPPCRA